MSQRVVGTQQALATLQEMQSLVDGPVTERSQQLRKLIARLTETGVWDGPAAARFRATTAPAAIAGLGGWLRQLDALSVSSRRVVADIMAADRGGTGAGGLHPALSTTPNDPPPPPYPQDPGQRAAWWQTLSESEREGYLKQYPLDLGYLATNQEIQAATGHQSMADLYMSETNKIAGVDPAHWPVDQGLAASDHNVRAVYEFYRQLYDADPHEFQWAGLARLAGDEFYGGMVSLDNYRTASDPSNPFNAGNSGDAVIYGQSSFLLEQFMLGQKRIYMDLAWQHEAYLHGGLPAIHALEQQYPALFDDTSRRAWDEIGAGNVSDGNRLLLQREQLTVVQPIYKQIHQGEFGIDGTLNSILVSSLEKSPVPEGGGVAFKDYPGSTDITDPTQRWNYIEGNMWPAYQKLLASGQAYDLINLPLDQRAKQFEAGA